MALGTKYHGIRSVADVKMRCRIVDGHWLWSGAVTSTGMLRIWAPRAIDGKMVARNAPRAVWELDMQRPVPEGCKVYRTCDDPLCVNPAHLACRSPRDQGLIVAQRGSLKGLPQKITANRKILLARSRVTPELFDFVLASPKTGLQLEQETGLGRSTISRIRTGQFTSILAVAAAPFTGLGARRA